MDKKQKENNMKQDKKLEQEKNEISKIIKINSLIEQKIKKYNELIKSNINPFPYKYDKNISSKLIKSKYNDLKPQETTQDYFNYAGRLITFRNLGKITFMNLRDEQDDLQIMLKKDYTEKYELIKKIDIGDFIGVYGNIIKTKTNEISILAKKIEILSKSFLIMPEKWHGLKDPELKYRQRYLDLIMNLQVRQDFKLRHEIIKFIRQYLDEKHFIEITTPILQTVYGGANAEPFKTHLNALNLDIYLRISPELYLKRLIIGGYERVYEIAKNFRNEGIDSTHNPEFTMIELYQAYADYYDMMDLTEDLIHKLVMKIHNKEIIEFNNKKINFKKPWKRLTMVDAIKDYLNIDVESKTDEELKEILVNNNIELPIEITRGILIYEIFDNLVSDKIIDPTFIIDFPIEVSPLTKKHRNKPGFVERFELFINGIEFANAYTELNDPFDQEQRFLKQQELKELGEKETHPFDRDFLEAMYYGMPPTGGLGIGIDRLVMLLLNKDTVKDVIMFPFIKPKSNENKEISKENKS